jgi:chromosome segregation ATPase
MSHTENISQDTDTDGYEIINDPAETIKLINCYDDNNNDNDNNENEVDLCINTPYCHNCTITLPELLKDTQECYSFDAPELKGVNEAYGKIDLRECIGSVKFEITSRNWARNATLELTLKTPSSTSIEDINIMTENCGNLFDEIDDVNKQTDTNETNIEGKQKDIVRKNNTCRVLNFDVSKIANAYITLNIGCKCEWTMRSLNDSTFDISCNYIPNFQKIITNIKNNETKALSKYRFSHTVHKISVDTLNNDITYYQNELKEKQLKISGLRTIKKNLEKKTIDITNELNELLSSNTKLKQKYDSLSATNIITDSELQYVKNKLKHIEFVNNFHKSELNVYKKKSSTLDTNLKIADNQLKIKNNKIDVITKEKEQLETQLKDVQDKLKNTVDEQSRLNEFIDSLELKINYKNTEINDKNTLLNDKLYELQNLKSKLESVTKSNHELNNCVESQTKRIVELEKDNKCMNNDINTKNTLLNELQQKYHNPDIKLKEKNDKLQKEVNTLKDQLSCFHSDYDELDNAYDGLQEKFTTEKEQNEKLTCDIKALNETIVICRNTYEELDNEFDILEEELCESKADVVERDYRIKELEEIVENLKQELDDRTSYKTDFTSIFNKYNTLKDTYETNEKQRFITQERVNELTNEVVSLNTKLSEQESCLKTLKIENQSYCETLSSQKTLIEQISTDMDNFKNSNINLKKILEVKEKDIIGLEDIINEYKTELNKPVEYREGHKNLTKDNTYLKKQYENMKCKYNEIKKSFDKYVWDAQEREKLTAKHINKLQKKQIDKKEVMDDINDFHFRIDDTFNYYHEYFKSNKEIAVFVKEIKLLINDTLQYMEMNFGT